MHIKRRYLVLLISAFIIFIVSCSKEANYKVLSFLFDGVPDPNLTDELIDTIEVGDTTLIADTNNLHEIYVHSPYGLKECNTCHSDEIGVLVENQPSLCYSCHTDYRQILGELHGPVAAGTCTACHDPHKSKYENLIIKDRSDICFHCHDQEMLVTNDVHSLIESSSCIECHDPHGEENKYYLKNGACFECHDNYNDSYAYLHGPVGSGFCNSCHDMHSSQADYKLVLSGQELCFKCHKKGQVLENENHEGTEDFDCIECHNPHGGEDKYILN